ncbi:hypothetical protein AgCh_034264 [Apium graveolens]
MGLQVRWLKPVLTKKLQGRSGLMSRRRNGRPNIGGDFNELCKIFDPGNPAFAPKKGKPSVVLNGLLSRDDQKEAISIPIGIIPTGSNNFLVWTVLGVRDPVSAAIAIVKGALIATDVFAVEWVHTGAIHFGMTVTYFGFISDVLCVIFNEALETKCIKKSEAAIKGDWFMIEEVENAAFTDIKDVMVFVKWLDDELSYLVDERAVLKHFQCPEQKADTLRAAAFGCSDLKKLESEVSSFRDDP